jgi:hypothetical protein
MVDSGPPVLSQQLGKRTHGGDRTGVGTQVDNSLQSNANGNDQTGTKARLIEPKVIANLKHFGDGGLRGKGEIYRPETFRRIPATTMFERTFAIH